MSTSISVRTKDQANVTGTTTINYVNPEATGEQLESLASAFNALTTNTIIDVTRIDKRVLGSEIEKLPRNFFVAFASAPTVAVTTITSSQIAAGLAGEQGTQSMLFVYDGDDITPTISYASVEDADLPIFMIDQTKEWGIYRYDTSAKPHGTLTITLPETATYRSESVTITLAE